MYSGPDFSVYSHCMKIAPKNIISFADIWRDFFFITVENPLASLSNETFYVHLRPLCVYVLLPRLHLESLSLRFVPSFVFHAAAGAAYTPCYCCLGFSTRNPSSSLWDYDILRHHWGLVLEQQHCCCCCKLRERELRHCSFHQLTRKSLAQHPGKRRNWPLMVLLANGLSSLSLIRTEIRFF